jgi:hypothetical protein
MDECKMGGIEKVLDRAGRARGNVKRSVDQPTVRHPVQKWRAQRGTIPEVIGRLGTSAVRPDQSVAFANRESSNVTARWRAKAGQGWDGHAVTLNVKLPSMIRTLQHGILSEGLDLSHGKACAAVRALIRKQAWRAIGALPQHHALAEKHQRHRPVGRFTGQGNGPPPEMLLHGAKP